MKTPARLPAASAALAILLILAPAASAAAPKLKATAALKRASDALRLEVKVSSTKKLTAATRPRSVKVKGASKTYKLKKSSSTGKSVTFRSSAYKGADAQALGQLAGAKPKITITTRAGTRTLSPKIKAAPGVVITPPPSAPPPPPPPAQPQLTRNDAAGQQKMAGDLLLEWASFGSSGRTAEYRRLWFYADGQFRLNQINWNDVSGESCAASVTGTWVFKEGYTFNDAGGGTVVKVGITGSNGQSGDDVLTFPNAEPNNVYVGAGQNVTKYERNPQIAQNC